MASSASIRLAVRASFIGADSSASRKSASQCAKMSTVRQWMEHLRRSIRLEIFPLAHCDVIFCRRFSSNWSCIFSMQERNRRSGQLRDVTRRQTIPSLTVPISATSAGGDWGYQPVLNRWDSQPVKFSTAVSFWTYFGVMSLYALSDLNKYSRSWTRIITDVTWVYVHHSQIDPQSTQRNSKQILSLFKLSLWSFHCGVGCVTKGNHSD